MEGYKRLSSYVLGTVIYDLTQEFRAFRAIWVAPNKPNTPKLPKTSEEAANMLLTFCQMETFLLSKQIEALKEKFVREGGFRENLFQKRNAYKKRI